MPGQQTHADDDEYGNPHGERADVVQPFADVESTTFSSVAAASVTSANTM